METLIDTIEKEMDEKKITGLSVVVSNSDGLLWSEGFGLANKKTKAAFTEQHIKYWISIKINHINSNHAPCRKRHGGA